MQPTQLGAINDFDLNSSLAKMLEICTSITGSEIAAMASAIETEECV